MCIRDSKICRITTLRKHCDPQIEVAGNGPLKAPLCCACTGLVGIEREHNPLREASEKVEGYTDVIAFHLAEMPVAVATCGTAMGEEPVSYTHLRAHEPVLDLVCRLL